MRRWFEDLHFWCGKKLYGPKWPPMYVLVLTQTTPIVEEKPKWVH